MGSGAARRRTRERRVTDMKSDQSAPCEFCGFHATDAGYTQHFAHLQREHGGNVALMEECQRVDALLVRERVTPAILAVLVGSQMTNEATRRTLAALLRDGARMTQSYESRKGSA